MSKLTHAEGYDLLKVLLNHHVVTEHGILEDRSDIKDTVISKLGEKVYTAALKWSGGLSYEERRRFHRDLDEEYENCARREFFDDEIDAMSISEVTDVIMELTVAIRPYIDSELKPQKSTHYDRVVNETKQFVKCPNCQTEMPYHGYGNTKCNHCRIIFQAE